MSSTRYEDKHQPPEKDVAFLDEYAKGLGLASRSAVVQRAVRLLRAFELGPAYTEAWQEFEAEGAADAWDAVVGDGLDHPERS